VDRCLRSGRPPDRLPAANHPIPFFTTEKRGRR
jgi:hypothetical protein